MTTLDSTRSRLRAAGQEHLLTFHDALDAGARARLLSEIESLDLGAVPTLVRDYVRAAPAFELPACIEPAVVCGRDARDWDRSSARARGESLLRAGRVAAFTVAGGQGSRLGYEGPKGCYPAGAVTGKPLFRFFAEGLLATALAYGRVVPWAIMTSPLNHEATVAFFREHRFFGLDPDDVRFFPQGTMPSFEMGSGRILLADKGEVALNPDGHGGAVRALHESGTLDAFGARGIEHLSYFQVDNPIVRVADPVFLGLHAGGTTVPAPASSSGEMSSKMVAKAYPGEKLGMFCRAGRSTGGLRTCVIEYSDLPRERQEERLPDASLRFGAGSIAIHVISLSFLSRMAREGALPYHRAEKKVGFVDPATGARVEPAAPNAVKLERFIFDALALADRSLVYEVERVEEFAPIKNAEGADSPASSSAIQTERAARWLEAAGVRVARRADGQPDCVIELSPLTALEPGDLARARLPSGVRSGERLAL